MRERAKECGPLDGSLRSRPDLTFFHPSRLLSCNIIEFTAVLGAPAASTVQKGAAWGVTIRLTRFVVGETLILSARMPMTSRHGTCDREVEMTPPTLTAAATAEVDVRASA
jgi:hypothetical protein